MFDTCEVGDFLFSWCVPRLGNIKRSRGGDFFFCDFVALANFENRGQCRAEIRVGEVLGVQQQFRRRIVAALVFLPRTSIIIIYRPTLFFGNGYLRLRADISFVFVFRVDN